jgi:hypothetical protein
MPEGYGTHRDYMEIVREEADSRQEAIESALREAFTKFIENRQVEVILFTNMTALDLSMALLDKPLILKPLLACCNIAARAIERDLGIKNLNTYSPRLNEDLAKVIAGYIKPFLPSYLELPALSRIDRISYIDKEIRKTKGRWEMLILAALNRHSKRVFRKRMFTSDGEQFEIDAATPQTGDIQVGIDIKRIEARGDIRKRCDEIVNKGRKLKTSFPQYPKSTSFIRR